ncbi:MAG: hypothetical protein ACI9O6_003346 [Glaciecola sp.]|jgi:hypothetical protein
MNNIESLRTHYKLDIESPFILNLSGENVSFDALIKGFGSRNGMIISKNGQLLQENSDEIISSGYGYSSFDIFCKTGIEGFDELLEDWGKIE